MTNPIKFYAQISKVQTLADGGLRFTFDVPESAIMAAAELMAFKRHGVVADIVVTAREAVTDCNDETEKEPKGGGSNVDRHRPSIR